ncbi:MAG: hypothetical protein R3E89_15355 [Thiolinea sp.]
MKSVTGLRWISEGQLSPGKAITETNVEEIGLLMGGMHQPASAARGEGKPVKLRLEPRPQPSKAMVYLSPLLAIALMMVFGLIVFTFLGQNPVKAFHAFFVEPINDACTVWAS